MNVRSGYSTPGRSISCRICRGWGDSRHFFFSWHARVSTLRTDPPEMRLGLPHPPGRRRQLDRGPRLRRVGRQAIAHGNGMGICRPRRRLALRPRLCPWQHAGYGAKSAFEIHIPDRRQKSRANFLFQNELPRIRRASASARPIRRWRNVDSPSHEDWRPHARARRQPKDKQMDTEI